MTIKAGVAGLVFGLLALICSAISLGLPYWQDIDADGVTGNQGLYRYTYKISGVQTSGNVLNTLSGSKKTSLQAVRGLVISGTSLLLLATFTVVIFLRCLKKRCPGIFAAVSCFLSTAANTAAVVLFHIKLEGGGDSSYHAGYYLACSAAFLATVAGGLLMKAAFTAAKLNASRPGADPRLSPKQVFQIAVAGLVLAVLAIACSAVAMGIPYWQDLDTDTISGHHGLWRYSITTSGVKNTGNYLNYLSGSDRNYLRAVRGLMIAGLSCLLLAIITILIFVCTKKRWLLGFIGAVCCFVSVAVHVAVVALFKIKLEGSGDTSYHAGFYLAIAAAVVSFISGGLVIVAAIRTKAIVKESSDASSDNGEKRRKCFSICTVVGLVFSIVAIACSAVAMGIPYWQDLDTDTISGHHGLWRYSITTSGAKTSGNYLNLLSGSDRTYLRAVRGLMIAGLSCVLIAIITILIFVCTKKKRMGFVGAVFCFLSVIAHLVALILFGVKLEGSGDSSYHAGFYLAIAGGFISLIAGIIVMTIAIRSRDKVHDQSERQSQSTKRGKKKRCCSIVIVGLVLAMLAVACSAVAMGIPYWQDLDTDTASGHHGLWRYSITTSGVKNTGNYHNYLTGSDRNYLTAVRWLIGSGLGCLLLAIITILIYVCTKKRWLIGFIGAVFCFLSVVAHLVALILFGVKLEGSGDSSYHAGFYLAIAGGFISLVAGILVMIVAIRARNKIHGKSGRNSASDNPDSKKGCSSLAIVGLVLAVLAITCSAIAIGISYWQDLDTGTTSGHHGLWRYSLSVAGVKDTGNYADFLSGSDKNYLRFIRWDMIAGLGFLLFEIIAILAFVCSKKRQMGFIGAAFCFITVVVHLVGLILFGVKLEGSGDSSYHVGFYLAIAGDFVGLVSGIIVLIAAIRTRAKVSDQSDGNSSPGNRDKKKRCFSMVLVGLLFGVLAIVCSAVAMGIPYWQDLDTDTASGHHGLWRYSITTSGVKNTGNYVNYLSGSDRNYLRAVRGLMLAGLSCLLLAIITILIFVYTKKKWLICFIGAIFFFLSVVSHLVALILFGVKLEGSGDSSYHAGFYLAIAGGFISLVAGIIIMIVALRTRKKADKSENGPGGKKSGKRGGKKRRLSVVFVGLLLIVLALACSAIAIGISYWQDLDTGTVSGHHGLWRYTLTVAGVKGSGNYLNNLSGSDRTYLKAVRGLMISGISCLFIAIVTVLVFILIKKHWMIVCFGAVCCFLSVLGHLIALILFGVKLEGSGDSSYHAAFYLAIAGGFISLVAGIVVIIGSLRSRRKVHDQSENSGEGRDSEKNGCQKCNKSILLVVGLILVGVLVLACSAIALGIPYWQHLDTGVFTGDHGLYRYSIKTSGVESSGNYKNLLSSSRGRYLDSVRGLVISGLACILIAMIIVLVFIFTKMVHPFLGIAGAVFCFLSVATHTAAVAIFGAKLDGDGDSSFHAGFYLAITAAALCLIIGIIILVICLRILMKRDKKSDKRDENDNVEKPVAKKTDKPKPARERYNNTPAVAETIAPTNAEPEVVRTIEPKPRSSPERQVVREPEAILWASPEPQVARQNEPKPRASPIKETAREPDPVRNTTGPVVVMDKEKEKTYTKPKQTRIETIQTTAREPSVHKTTPEVEEVECYSPIIDTPPPKVTRRREPPVHDAVPRAIVFESKMPVGRAPSPVVYRPEENEKLNAETIQRRKVWKRTHDIGLWDY